MSDGFDQVVDHIVVGAGSAGSAVARRLHDAGRTVLVVEAGASDDDPRVADPAKIFALRGPGQATDWNLRTTPQEHLGGRRIAWPRGRVLGGSSAINGMIWVRGDRRDFDAWAEAAPGWSYDELVPVFRRIEDVTPPGHADHGRGGPLPVDRSRVLTDLSEAMLAAAARVGIPRVDDHNTGTLDGIAPIDLNIRDGRRVSAWQAYGAPIADSPRLRVLTDALVTRVLVERGRAIGIEAVPAGGGAPIRVRSDGDIVLAAGAIGSPHLLLLSGIGPADELRALGIEPLVDASGVGANLHDHPLSQVAWRARRPFTPPRHHGIELHYFASSTGGEPDTQPLFSHGAYPIDGWDIPFDGVYAWMPGLVRPRSRGRLRLVSADPTVTPEIDPAYLAEAADVDALLWSIEQARELGAAPELREFDGGEIAPGPGVRTRADLLDYLRRSLDTYYHPAGTARMGSDAGSVIDPRLLVRGVTGLRVADASIMPVVTTGNTHAPAVLIGERAAEFILEESR